MVTWQYQFINILFYYANNINDRQVLQGTKMYNRYYYIIKQWIENIYYIMWRKKKSSFIERIEYILVK